MALTPEQAALIENALYLADALNRNEMPGASFVMKLADLAQTLAEQNAVVHFCPYGSTVTLCGLSDRVTATTERRDLTTCADCRSRFTGPTDLEAAEARNAGLLAAVEDALRIFDEADNFNPSGEVEDVLRNIDTSSLAQRDARVRAEALEDAARGWTDRLARQMHARDYLTDLAAEERKKAEQPASPTGTDSAQRSTLN